MISSITCQSYNYHFCSSPPNDTNNYISKLDSVLNSLPSKASVNSFYNESSDGVYILFLCRGDVSAATCQTCVKNATQVIRKQCSSNRTAIIWYNECMLHYSNTNFFGLFRTSPDFLMWNTDNITVPDEPNYGALGLVYSLIDYASNTYSKFGTDDRIVVSNGSRHGYALVQCARDIDNSSCRSCLWILTEKIRKCCEFKIGWRIMSPSCNIRYEEYEFYKQPSPAPFPSVPDAYDYAAPQPMPNVDYQSKGLELIDPNIVDNCPISEVLRWIHIALLCAQDDPATRPTMSQVVLMLGSQAIDLPSPSTAPYSVSRFTTMSDESSSFGIGTGILTSDQTKSTSTSNY
ncbi:hypothetical protein LWI29_003762 [Acer saccharum]|uniref:Gnk2-homologous domain-containing protein n=1 Tax=Acer saccharum TaxID=4024 RepID=A0AA39VF74_ACESA|nr:hypothetical protein LWI29_003762 [Acer saccharum]